MPAPKGQGIADDRSDDQDPGVDTPKRARRRRGSSKDGIASDSAAYEEVGAVEEEPRPARRPSRPGIASDASAFEDLVEETTSKARTLDSDWLYQLNGQVFGPVKPRELLEMLYSGQIGGDTPIAISDGEFAALRRYGVFRVHLPKVAKHQKELEEAREQERAAERARTFRRIRWVVIAIAIGAASTYALVRFVRSRKEEHARAEKKRKEAQLLQEIENLMASVTIEPPLIGLVDERDDQRDATRRRSRRAVARFSGGGGSDAPPGVTDNSELTRPEIMGGVAKVFGGFKRCIVEQMQRDPESVPDQIGLTFSINNDGIIENISLGDRALRKTPLRDCMAQQLDQVRFRRFKGEVQNVEYPITIGRR